MNILLPEYDYINQMRSSFNVTERDYLVTISDPQTREDVLLAQLSAMTGIIKDII